MIALFAQAPALPLHAAGKYVAGAYIVFLLVLLSYLGIMALRLVHNQRELAELRAMIEERERKQDTADLAQGAPEHAQDPAPEHPQDPAAGHAQDPAAGHPQASESVA